MKPKAIRLISGIGLSAVFVLVSTAVSAADGNGLETRAQPSASFQQPMATVKAPAAQGVSAEERVKWIPTPQQLNVPGNPAFGRVASS